MGILTAIKEWMINSKEKKDFGDAWDKEYGKVWSDSGVEKYHCAMAYEVYVLSQKVKELEDKLL